MNGVWQVCNPKDKKISDDAYGLKVFHRSNRSYRRVKMKIEDRPHCAIHIQFDSNCFECVNIYSDYIDAIDAQDEEEIDFCDECGREIGLCCCEEIDHCHCGAWVTCKDGVVRKIGDCIC